MSVSSFGLASPAAAATAKPSKSIPMTVEQPSPKKTRSHAMASTTYAQPVYSNSNYYYSSANYGNASNSYGNASNSHATGSYATPGSTRVAGDKRHHQQLPALSQGNVVSQQAAQGRKGYERAPMVDDSSLNSAGSATSFLSKLASNFGLTGKGLGGGTYNTASSGPTTNGRRGWKK